MADSTKTLKTRVQLKSDTEANWKKSVLITDGGEKESGNSFVPLLGELIVYTADDAHPFSRIKIGNGVTNVIKLPFIDAGTINGEQLPEEELVLCVNRQAFPSPGVTNKLYIDLQTKTIYCYEDLSGYTKLSNFTYTVTKDTVSRITGWSVGALTILEQNNGILKANTGILPTLNYYNTQVVSDITKE